MAIFPFTSRPKGVSLGQDYPWRGNFRELEQCLRNVLIRGRYTPLSPRAVTPEEKLLGHLQRCDLTAEELLSRYCTLAYSQAGSYSQAARRLNLDRRTVKAKVDPALLEKA